MCIRDRIKPGQHHCLRGIVDNQFHARQGLKGTNVASLSANDAAFHLIIGKLYDGNGGFRHMIRRAPLNRSHNQIPCLLVRFFLCFVFKFLN